ncbi:MAG: V-type ATP synthase subunit I [Anaerolineales bacterium]
MTALQIVVLKGDLSAAASTLYSLGSLEVLDINQADFLPLSTYQLSEEQQSEREQVRATMTRLDTVADPLPDPWTDQIEAAGKARVSLDDIEAGLQELQPRVESLLEKRDELSSVLESLPRYRKTVRRIQAYVPASGKRPGTTVFAFMVDHRHRATLQEIRKELLRSLGGEVDFGSGTLGQDMQALVVVVPEQAADRVDELLGGHEASRLQLPQGIPHDSVESMLTAIEDRLDQLPEQISDVKLELESIAEKWRPKLSLWRAWLLEKVDKAAFSQRLGETERTAIITGWALTSEVPSLERALEDALSGKVAIEPLPHSPELEQTKPVVLSNPKPAESFESLVELLGLPSSESIDPSPLMLIFMPLFFGMMLGDIGYGLLLLGVSWLFRRRMDEGIGKDLLQVLSIGAGWAIVFGILFGEALGTLGHDLGLEPLWFDRGAAEYLPTLPAITIGVGAAHIVLGLVIGLWEALQHRHRSHLLERGGKLLGLVGLILLTSVLAELMPGELMTPTVVLVILGVVLLGMSEGKFGWVLAPIEFMSLIANVLSYLRIAAIGLASVFLATVANEIAGTVGSLIVGVIIAVLMHLLNVVMGAFSPSIHSLRLHYVEFFRKFYETGGQPFKPFGDRSKPRRRGRLQESL